MPCRCLIVCQNRAQFTGQSCRVLIRNYRPDGTLFWNETMIQPIRDPAGPQASGLEGGEIANLDLEDYH